MGKKHSAVCYIFREGAFIPVQKTKPLRNEFGLDLFQYKGAVYEGKTGLHLCPAQDAEYLSLFIKSHGGIEKVRQVIESSLEHTGLSPRYTRPNEKKKDIFPPKEKDEKRVYAKDLMGNKHFYYRFYNENGIELYTLEKEKDFYRTVFIPCEGFMVGIGQHHRLAEILKLLPTLEHGIRGEVQRIYWDGMARPRRTMPPFWKNAAAVTNSGMRSGPSRSASVNGSGRNAMIPLSGRRRRIFWQERRW